jgi:hypothetical protein
MLKKSTKKKSFHNVEKQRLKSLMNDLEYFILIKFIPNQSHVSTLYYNIFMYNNWSFFTLKSNFDSKVLSKFT